MWAYSKKRGENSDGRMREAPTLRFSGQAEGEISGLKQPLYLLVGSTLPRLEIGQRRFANEPEYPHLGVDNLRLCDPSRTAAHDLKAKRSYL